jgi:hypothetical protein
MPVKKEDVLPRRVFLNLADAQDFQADNTFRMQLPVPIENVFHIDWVSTNIPNTVIQIDNWGMNITSGGNLYWRYLDNDSNQRDNEWEILQNSEYQNPFTLRTLNIKVVDYYPVPNPIWQQWSPNTTPLPQNIYNYNGVLYKYVPNVNITSTLADGHYSTGLTGEQDGTMVTNICEALQAALNSSVSIDNTGHIRITLSLAEAPSSLHLYDLTIPSKSLSDLVGLSEGATLTPTWGNATLTWQFPNLPSSISSNIILTGATISIGSSITNSTPGPNNPLWTLAPMIVELEVFCVKF